MDLKVTGKYFVKQKSGLVSDEAGNKLLAKSVMFCKMTPFIITEGDIYNFTGGTMEAVHQVDNQFLEFFKGQVEELQTERTKALSLVSFELRGVVGIKLGDR